MNDNRKPLWRPHALAALLAVQALLAPTPTWGASFYCGQQLHDLKTPKGQELVRRLFSRIDRLIQAEKPIYFIKNTQGKDEPFHPSLKDGDTLQLLPGRFERDHPYAYSMRMIDSGNHREKSQWIKQFGLDGIIDCFDLVDEPDSQCEAPVLEELEIYKALQECKMPPDLSPYFRPRTALPDDMVQPKPTFTLNSLTDSLYWLPKRGSFNGNDLPIPDLTVPRRLGPKDRFVSFAFPDRSAPRTQLLIPSPLPAKKNDSTAVEASLLLFLSFARKTAEEARPLNLEETQTLLEAVLLKQKDLSKIEKDPWGNLARPAGQPKDLQKSRQFQVYARLLRRMKECLETKTCYTHLGWANQFLKSSPYDVRPEWMPAYSSDEVRLRDVEHLTRIETPSTEAMAQFSERAHRLFTVCSTALEPFPAVKEQLIFGLESIYVDLLQLGESPSANDPAFSSHLANRDRAYKSALIDPWMNELQTWCIDLKQPAPRQPVPEESCIQTDSFRRGLLPLATVLNSGLFEQTQVLTQLKRIVPKERNPPKTTLTFRDDDSFRNQLSYLLVACGVGSYSEALNSPPIYSINGSPAYIPISAKCSKRKKP